MTTGEVGSSGFEVIVEGFVGTVLEEIFVLESAGEFPSGFVGARPLQPLESRCGMEVHERGIFKARRASVRATRVPPFLVAAVKDPSFEGLALGFVDRGCERQHDWGVRCWYF